MVNIRHTIRRYDKRPKTFPEKPKKKELDMAKREELIRYWSEIKQPKQPNYWR